MDGIERYNERGELVPWYLRRQAQKLNHQAVLAAQTQVNLARIKAMRDHERIKNTDALAHQALISVVELADLIERRTAHDPALEYLCRELHEQLSREMFEVLRRHLRGL